MSPVSLGLVLLLLPLVTSSSNQSAAPSEFLDSLEFVGRASTSFGCPIFVHGVAGEGKFFLEPAFCLADSLDLQAAEVRLHFSGKFNYVTLPLLVTEESLLTPAAVRWLNRTGRIVKSVNFLRPIRIYVEDKADAVFNSLDILWSPGEPTASLRIKCDAVTCTALLWLLRHKQTSILDSFTIIVEVSVDKLTRTLRLPVSVANGTAGVAEFTRRRDLPACTQLRRHAVYRINDCLVRAHKRTDRKSEFLLEPLLCRQRLPEVQRDYRTAEYFVRIVVTVRDSDVLDAVAKRLAAASPTSVTFTELEGAEFFVGRRLRRWRMGDLRLRADGNEGELRVFCTSRGECERLRRILQRRPSQFWPHIHWRSTSSLNSTCAFVSRRSRIALRLRRAVAVGDSPLFRRVSSRWSFWQLRDRIVTRDSRRFLVIQQRDCSNTVDFARSWREYEDGFGDDRNFWLGLSIIHDLTSQEPVTMRLEVTMWSAKSWHAEYSNFVVEGADTDYTMSYKQMNRKASTLAIDVMKHSNQSRFTTRDRDNDNHSSQYYCSPSHGYSGWWFNRCTGFNPNGVYHSWYQHTQRTVGEKYIWLRTSVPRTSSRRTSSRLSTTQYNRKTLKDTRLLLELSSSNAAPFILSWM